MTVYADEAFLLNGAVDYLLLICAAKLGGGRIARLRLLAAALFGGLYAAATLFAPLGVLPGLPMKLISLVVMLLIASRRARIQRQLRAVAEKQRRRGESGKAGRAPAARNKGKGRE